MDNAKALLYTKRWDICVNEMEQIVKGGIQWKLLVMKRIMFFGKWLMIM